MRPCGPTMIGMASPIRPVEDVTISSQASEMIAPALIALGLT